jgi:hypothetical protein
MPLDGLTAIRAPDLLGLAAGQTILVTGAAGGLGGSGVQLGAMRGLRVIAAAGDDDEELVRGLGAVAFVPRSAGLAVAVRGLVPGGADAVPGAAVPGYPAMGAVLTPINGPGSASPLPAAQPPARQPRPRAGRPPRPPARRPHRRAGTLRGLPRPRALRTRTRPRGQVPARRPQPRLPGPPPDPRRRPQPLSKARGAVLPGSRNIPNESGVPVRLNTPTRPAWQAPANRVPPGTGMRIASSRRPGEDQG